MVRWVCRAGKRDVCSALAVLVGPAPIIFFLTVLYVQYFNSFVPITSPSKLGRQPCWVACLLVCASLVWSVPILLARMTMQELFSQLMTSRNNPRNMYTVYESTSENV
jgi:hypothetical protein